MAWTECMQNKIIGHYGSGVTSCVNAITTGDFTSVLECMATVLDISDPEVWVAEQAADFATWSLECEL